MASAKHALQAIAELTARRSQSVLSHPSTLSIASRKYHNCCCRNNKPISTISQALQQRAAYTSTSSLLSTSSNSSSPFRLSSSRTQRREQETQTDEYDEKVLQDGGEGYYSPYKPKRQWPPDMSKLSHKHQLRLERKYRRRAALKYARPRWVKFTKLAQWGIIIFVVVYSLLFMDWAKEGEEHPFEDFRKDFFASINSLFAPAQPPRRKKE